MYWLKVLSIVITGTWLFESGTLEAIAAFVGSLILFLPEIKKSFGYKPSRLSQKRKDEIKTIARREGINPNNLRKQDLINKIVASSNQKRWYHNRIFHFFAAIGLALFISVFLISESPDFLKIGQERIESKIDRIVDDPVKKVKSGFSFYIALTVNEINDKRRKFIFDYGESERRNRVSLYFDTKNNLIFRLINENGETNSCIAPVSSYSFHDGVPFFIYCEAGVSNTYSYMRIRINDREIARNHVDFKMNYFTSDFFDKSQRSAFSMVRKPPRLPTDESKTKFFNPKYEGKINADIDGKYLSDFWPYEFQIYGWPLKKDQIDHIWEEVREIVFPYSDFFKRTLHSFQSAYRVDENGNIVAIE